MNYWLYDREYVYPRIAKGLCRGHWLEGVQQGAALTQCLCRYQATLVISVEIQKKQFKIDLFSTNSLLHYDDRTLNQVQY